MTVAETKSRGKADGGPAAAPVRAGVIGAGAFGRFHARKYAASANAEFVGAFDPDRRAAERVCAESGGRAFGALEELLGSVEAVSIAAPAARHGEIAEAALSAGRHLLIEKPIATDCAQSDHLIRSAREKGLVLQVGHQERFVLDAMRLDPEAQPIKFHSVRAGPFTGRCSDVSVVLDLLIHDLDLLLALKKSPARAVRAEAMRSRTESADIVKAEVEFEDGGVAELYASRDAPMTTRVMRLEYADGSLEFDFLSRRMSGAAPSACADVAAANRSLEAAAADPLGLAVEHFLGCIATGATPRISGEDGRAALALALEIERAAGLDRTGSPRVFANERIPVSES